MLSGVAASSSDAEYSSFNGDTVEGQGLSATAKEEPSALSFGEASTSSTSIKLPRTENNTKEADTDTSGSGISLPTTSTNLLDHIQTIIDNAEARAARKVELEPEPADSTTVYDFIMSTLPIKEPKNRTPRPTESTECALCHKMIEPKNRVRHGMFHNKIFRFSCSLCGYQAHIKCNVKTHIVKIHEKRTGETAEIIENKSTDLAFEMTRVYMECFPGERRLDHLMKVYNNRDPTPEDSAATGDSGEGTSAQAVVNSAINNARVQHFEDKIANRTCSSRLIRSLEANNIAECQRCERMVSKPKARAHSVTHASVFRYKCSMCGFRNHCQFNLRSHIKRQHGEEADVIDEINPALQQEYESLLIECFPEKALLAEARKRSFDSASECSADIDGSKQASSKKSRRKKKEETEALLIPPFL